MRSKKSREDEVEKNRREQETVGLLRKIRAEGDYRWHKEDGCVRKRRIYTRCS